MLMDETGDGVVLFIKGNVREVWKDESERHLSAPVLENKCHHADERCMIFDNIDGRRVLCGEDLDIEPRAGVRT